MFCLSLFGFIFGVVISFNTIPRNDLSFSQYVLKSHQNKDTKNDTLQTESVGQTKKKVPLVCVMDKPLLI